MPDWINKFKRHGKSLAVPKEVRHSTGVYAIVNLENGKRYIGATRDSFMERAQHHRHYLHYNAHANTYLQNDWNSQGPSKFTFEILEVFPDGTSPSGREKYWIDSFDPKTLYNIHREDADTPKGVRRRSETRARMSESQSRRYGKPQKQREPRKPAAPKEECARDWTKAKSMEGFRELLYTLERPLSNRSAVAPNVAHLTARKYRVMKIKYLSHPNHLVTLVIARKL